MTYKTCHVDATDGAFDKDTGIFKAVKPGHYRFQFNFMARKGNNACVLLYRDSLALNWICQPAGSYYGSTGASVITKMEVGNKVWVRMNTGTLYADGNKEINFEGFFLGPA